MRLQLSTLFVCGLCMAVIGAGTMPLLSIYALRLGASTEAVSTMIAAAYGALAIGAAGAHRRAALAASPKRALVAAGLLSAPMLGLLGQTSSIGQLAALFLGAWFLGGVAGTLIGALVGLAADSQQRAQVFGVLWLREPLGALIGGALFGAVGERLGLPAAFVLAGGAAVLWPLLGAVGLRTMREPAERRKAAPAAPRDETRLPPAFTVLLITAVLGTIPVFAGRLGTALTMQAQGFGPGAIGSTVLVGGLLTVPLLPLIGMLADRLGRRPVTMLAYGLSALGMLTLAGAVDLWQFWLATALLSIGSSACGALTATLAADLLPGCLLARGFGHLGVANWVAASLGSVGVGFGLAVMGATGLYLAATGLAIVAAGLLGVAGGWHAPALALRNYERR